MWTGPSGVCASNACSCDGEAGRLQLLRDVVARLGRAGRAGDARPDRDQLPEVCQRARAVERSARRWRSAPRHGAAIAAASDEPATATG